MGCAWDRSAYSLSSLKRRKPRELVLLEEKKDEKEGEGLVRCVSVVELIAYGVGSTIGAGVFVTTGVVARQSAGPGIVISFLTAGFASLLSAFCYAEFAASIPVSGSAYTFAYASLGELMAWFIGWNLTLEYAISASAIARGWAGYLVNFVGAVNGTMPQWMYNISVVNTAVNETTGQSYEYVALSMSPLAVLIVIVCTIILLMGVQNTARTNLIFTIINMVIILFVVGYGATYVDTANWDPFLPMGFSGALKGAGTVFFSFVGFDTVTTLAEEVKKPQRDLPLGIIGTLSIATVLYMAVSLIVTGMIHYTDLSTTAPLSDAFLMRGNQWAGIVIAFGSVSTLSSTTLCALLGQPRIYYKMARDGLLFRILGHVNKKHVPVAGTIFTAICAGTLAFFLDIDSLTDMISIGTLLAFSVVCAGVVIVRHSSPENPRPWLTPVILLCFFLASVATSAFIIYSLPIYAIAMAGAVTFALMIWLVVITVKLGKNQCLPSTFRAPLVPFIPCLGIFVNVYLTVTLEPGAWYRLLAWTAVGMLIYFLYGIRNSRLNEYSQGLLGLQVNVHASPDSSTAEKMSMATPSNMESGKKGETTPLLQRAVEKAAAEEAEAFEKEVDSIAGEMIGSTDSKGTFTYRDASRRLYFEEGE